MYKRIYLSGGDFCEDPVGYPDDAILKVRTLCIISCPPLMVRSEGMALFLNFCLYRVVCPNFGHHALTSSLQNINFADEK